MKSNLIKKNLSFYHVFSIASGAMISSGLFVLPGIAHSMAGPGVIWSYFLAGVLALVGGLCVSELSTAMPKSGGDYFFVARGFGPAIGTVSGILSWLFLSLKSAFAIVGIIAFIKLLLPDASFEIGFFLCLVFILLNIFGVKEAANVQLFLVIILFILLTIFIFRGIPKIDSALLIPFRKFFG